MVHLTWDLNSADTISDFAPSEDVLDFGALPAGGLQLPEVDGDLHIEVPGTGGHTYVIEVVQAEDLSLENLAAASWNDGVLHDHDGVVEQLDGLGSEDLSWPFPTLKTCGRGVVLITSRPQTGLQDHRHGRS